MSSEQQNIGWFTADWPVPPGVRAGTTTRQGGVSVPPYDSFNLATHVGDKAWAVQHNRELLSQALGLPAEPCWLEQVHGNTVIDAARAHGVPRADAAYTTQAGVVCVVLTADCLPVLFCTADGHGVAAAHAGWRGLAGGVLEATIAALCEASDSSPTDLCAWLGPAIGPAAFEVGEEVRAAFMAIDPAMQTCFSANRAGHYLADIYALAGMLLERQGVTAIYGGGHCTMNEPQRFYSYRREKDTGRMASCIWIGT
jgi:YfiH family protein